MQYVYFINPAFNHELSNTGAHISGWMLEQVPQLPVCGCVGTMACYGATIAPRGAGAWFLLIPQMLERRHVAPLTVSLLSQPALCTWLINRIGICRDQYNPSQLRYCKVYLNVWRIALIMQCFGEIKGSLTLPTTYNQPLRAAKAELLCCHWSPPRLWGVCPSHSHYTAPPPVGGARQRCDTWHPPDSS